LTVTLEGKTMRVVADAPLPRDKWTDCRIEIDGKKITLWIDGRKAAEKQATFRPADVYLPGVEKRNFIAAAREGRSHFKGAIDHLRVWHTVYDDFTKAPPPQRHSPRRPDRNFIDTCKIEYGGAADAAKRRDAIIAAKLAEKPMGLDFYEGVAKKVKPMKEAITDIPRHAPEHNWLHNLVWTMNNNHYNYRYQTYIKDEVIRKLGITIRLCEEDFGSLEKTLKQQAEGKWHTRCDWDYRTKYEVKGSIKDLPQVQKWLKRNRGEAMPVEP